jgi:hypothetical protein
VHGAGPPAAQRIMIGRQADLDKKIGLAKRVIGIGSCRRMGTIRSGAV